MFELLLERRWEEIRITTGSQVAAVFNANPFRGPKAQWLTPSDIFPARETASAKERRNENLIEQLTAMFGCGPSKPGKGKMFVASRRAGRA